MRKQLAIVIGVSLLLVLAGCGKPQDPPTETDNTAKPVGNEIAAAPVVADVQPATNATGSPLDCLPHQDEPPDSKRVTAGTYCVCQVPENQGKHPTTNVKGEHMHVGESVVVGRLADQTAVKLGATELTFTRLEEGNGLSAMVSYPHVDADTDANERPITHLVNISRWEPPAEGPPIDCDRTKNLITISYCYWDPKSTAWECAQGIPGAHLGDIHAQN